MMLSEILALKIIQVVHFIDLYFLQSQVKQYEDLQKQTDNIHLHRRHWKATPKQIWERLKELSILATATNS